MSAAAEALEEALAVLPPDATEPEAHSSDELVEGPHAIRPRVILSWAALPLLALSALAFSVAMSWHAADVALLGGAYGTTGSFALLAGFARF